MGGQLIFRLGSIENFLIPRDRLVSSKVTNTISYAEILVSHSAPSPLMHRQKAKCLLRLNHDCHAKICRASIWSATATGTKEYTWPTNWWIIFMYFLEYWLKNVVFGYLVNPMQNQARSTKWHSAINQSMR